jgi:hypothetical protein
MNWPDFEHFLSQGPWLYLHQARIETVLAILAIIFATVQYIDSRRLKKDVEAVAKSMSTRFIGQFPDSMPEIIDVIKRTDSTLDIMADVCAFGHYSQPILFQEYKNKIVELANKKKLTVRMLIYNSDIELAIRKNQFPQNKFDQEKSSERYDRFYGANLDLNRGGDWAGFMKMLQAEQDAHFRSFNNAGVEIKQLSENVLVSLWMEDREDLVFSFHNRLDYEKEVSFRTRDGNLISVLHTVFERYWEQGVDVQQTAVNQ